jgi:hypothetical protein
MPQSIQLRRRTARMLRHQHADIRTYTFAQSTISETNGGGDQNSTYALKRVRL